MDDQNGIFKKLEGKILNLELKKIEEEEKIRKEYIEEIRRGISKMSSHPAESFSDIRSIIFDLHASVEYILNLIISFYYCPLLSERREDFQNTILSNISFKEKAWITKLIINISEGQFKTMSVLNTMRNFFGHFTPKKNKKILYRSKDILFGENVIDLLIDDISTIEDTLLEQCKKMIDDFPMQLRKQLGTK